MNAAPWAIVARREYVQRVRSTSFLVGTIVGPLILIMAASVPSWLDHHAGDVMPAVGVIDSAGVVPYGEALTTAVDSAPMRIWPAPLDLDRGVMAGLVAERALDAVLVISPDAARAEIIAGSAMEPSALARLQARLVPMVFEALVRQRAISLHLDGESVQALAAHPAWRVTTLAHPDPMRAAGLALVIGMLLYATLLTYGLATMRAVVEEKASRVVELLISSARPVDLLAGKILGIAALGVTQYLMWAAAAVVSIGPHGLLNRLAALPTGSSFGIGLACACIGYFVLGYALFAALYAMAGGVVSSLADAQHVHLPVTALLIAPVFLVWFVAASPDSTVVRVVSLVPVFAPVLMVARVSMDAASGSDVVLSVVLLAAAGLASLHLAARVYRAGILMRGKPATPREVLRWIRE